LGFILDKVHIEIGLEVRRPLLYYTRLQESMSLLDKVPGELKLFIGGFVQYRSYISLFVPRF
jgi:hypothetical protein